MCALCISSGMWGSKHKFWESKGSILNLGVMNQLHGVCSYLAIIWKMLCVCAFFWDEYAEFLSDFHNLGTTASQLSLWLSEASARSVVYQSRDPNSSTAWGGVSAPCEGYSTIPESLMANWPLGRGSEPFLLLWPWNGHSPLSTCPFVNSKPTHTTSSDTAATTGSSWMKVNTRSKWATGGSFLEAPKKNDQSLGSQSVVCRPAASTSPQDVLEMENLRPHPDLLGQNLHFNKTPRGLLNMAEFEKHVCFVLDTAVHFQQAPSISSPLWSLILFHLHADSSSSVSHGIPIVLSRHLRKQQFLALVAWALAPFWCATARDCPLLMVLW